MDQITCKSIVIDNGSSVLRAGFSGEDRPLCTFPTVVGHLTESTKKSFRCCFQRMKESYVGFEAQSKRELLHMNYPVERGIVTDWQNMEAIWSAAFEQLKAEPSQYSVLISQPYLRRKCNRKHLVETMFESFDVPAMQAPLSALLAMYGSCRTTGVVLDCGDGVCQAVPVQNCKPIEQSIERFELAGRDITDYLIRMLCKRGYYFDPNFDRTTVDEIKKNLCSVALDFAKDIKDIAIASKFLEKSFRLPDGQTVKVGSERFLCAEALFEPTHLGIDQFGIQQVIYDSVMKCATELRKELFSNILLSGGSTLFAGFAERLRTEVISLVPLHTTVNVNAQPERGNLTWIGGSVMTSLSTFPLSWVTKREYDESGSSVVYRKNM